VLKNPPAPTSDPLFGPNGIDFETFGTDLNPSVILQSIFSTGWPLPRTRVNSGAQTLS
jgi:hypothetical protein